ncbi:MAG: SOS response-associated peptidase [Alphaproteobacteria bacterium]|nr:SOS response-associated peptidase [Alphaproteobacteria bacterium]
MCGRFAITLPQDAMVNLFQATPSNDLPATPNYNVCPTTSVHTITSEGDGRQLKSMRWGFLPKWYRTLNGGPPLINARSETIANKPAFKEACRARRCLIPCDGFYEWHRMKGEKPIPYRVTRSDGEPLVMAGIWQDWELGGELLSSCAIVTTDANAKMADIHHRLPVILNSDDWSLWLGELGNGAARLMKPVSDDTVDLVRVSQAVNSNRATGLELWHPLSV